MKRNEAQLKRRTLIGTCLATILLSLPARGGWVQWTVAAGGNGHYYMAVPASPGLTWDIADQLAQAQGGYLATISSQAENDFVFSLIASPQFFTAYNGSGPAIGGLQLPGSAEPVGGWVWETGEAWTFSNWYPGQPDNGYGVNENRLEYFSYLGSTPAATWNDLNHDDSNLGGYVVEMVPEPKPFAFVVASLCCLRLRVLGGRKNLANNRSVGWLSTELQQGQHNHGKSNAA